MLGPRDPGVQLLKDQGRSQSSAIITAECGRADCGRKICGTKVVYEGDNDRTVYTDSQGYLDLMNTKVKNAFRRVG